MHGSNVVVPRKLRRRLLDKAWAKWLVPVERCLTLPVAVKRNRFLVPLWVLILVFLGRAITVRPVGGRPGFKCGLRLKYSKIPGREEYPPPPRSASPKATAVG